MYVYFVLLIVLFLEIFCSNIELVQSVEVVAHVKGEKEKKDPGKNKS